MEVGDNDDNDDQTLRLVIQRCEGGEQAARMRVECEGGTEGRANLNQVARKREETIRTSGIY